MIGRYRPRVGWIRSSGGRLKLALVALPIVAIPPIGMIAFGSHVAPSVSAGVQSASHAGAPRTGPCDIGVNLGGVSYWSTEYAFLDRMKTMTSTSWFGRTADGTVVHPALDE
ncbi:MAG TPA: hypothetical protein VNQ31_06215, partial [Sphingomonadaceae bacterium]|nr:hypothetical protein [Sphingomonadaceae bacterium]